MNSGDTPIRLLTIDLDGTLADTVGDLHASINEMQRARAAAARSEDEVRAWVGNGVERLVHRAITGAFDGESDAAVFQPALQLFQQAYTNNNGHSSKLYDGVASTLTYLQKAGVILACVTNKSEQFAVPLVHKLKIDHFFSQMISGDTLENKKPAPDQLLHASRIAAIPPESSAHVGDSISDIKSARAAGFKVICVDYGYNHGAPISTLSGELKPDSLLSAFAELKTLFPTDTATGATP